MRYVLQRALSGRRSFMVRQRPGQQAAAAAFFYTYQLSLWKKIADRYRMWRRCAARKARGDGLYQI